MIMGNHVDLRLFTRLIMGQAVVAHGRFRKQFVVQWI